MFDGQVQNLSRAADKDGRGYLVHDREITLNGLQLSVITMQPVDEFEHLQSGFIRQLGLWLGGILLALLTLLLLAAITWMNLVVVTFQLLQMAQWVEVAMSQRQSH